MAYEIVAEKCTSCGACAEVCPQGAISYAAKASAYQVNADKCIDCGACEAECGSGAPRLV